MKIIDTITFLKEFIPSIRNEISTFLKETIALARNLSEGN